MKEISKTFKIGEDLIVELFIKDKRVDYITVKAPESDRDIIEGKAEIIDRLAKLISNVNDQVDLRYSKRGCCIDHGYHEGYHCIKCNPVEEKESVTNQS